MLIRNLIFVLIAAMLMLAACGDDASNDATTSPTEARATLTPRPTVVRNMDSDADSQEEAEAVVLIPNVVDYDPALLNEGQFNFGIYCIACHGPDGKGLVGLGPDLTESEFVDTHTDEELLAFVIEGRTIDHPDNTTGITMPPRGGFPNLGDEEILSILAYIRSLE